MRPIDTICAGLGLGAVLLTACGGNDYSVADIGSAPPQPIEPPPDPSVPKSIPAEGGIWRGSDSDGNVYLLMAAPEEYMTRVTDLTLGYAGSVGYDYDENDDAPDPAPIGFFYWPVPLHTDPLAYAWSWCELDADWETQRPIEGKLECSGMPDGDWVRDIDLAFDPLYDVSAELELLSGHWTDIGNPGVDVLSFDGSGLLTGQHGDSGCVYLGNGSVIDFRYNLYEIEWSFANCSGDKAGLDELTFSGLATIDTKATPMTLTFVGLAESEWIAVVAQYAKN